MAISETHFPGEALLHSGGVPYCGSYCPILYFIKYIIGCPFKYIMQRPVTPSEKKNTMHLWFYLLCRLGDALGISPNENWFSAECSISLNMYSISGAPGEDETRPWVWDSSSDQPLIISNPLHHQTSHQSTYPSINIFRLRHLHLHLSSEEWGWGSSSWEKGNCRH